MEAFFKAKNIRFKNEMTDDVSFFRRFLQHRITTNIFSNSLLRSSQPPYRTMRAPATTMLALFELIVDLPTKMKNPSTRTSRQTQTQTSQKNTIPTTKAAAAVLTPRWEMLMLVLLAVVKTMKMKGQRRRARPVESQRKDSR